MGQYIWEIDIQDFLKEYRSELNFESNHDYLIQLFEQTKTELRESLASKTDLISKVQQLINKEKQLNMILFCLVYGYNIPEPRWEEVLNAESSEVYRESIVLGIFDYETKLLSHYI